MKNLYRTISQHLHSLHKNSLQGNALKRLNSLSGFICGMIRKGSSHLVDIGSGLAQDINSNSKTVAAKRFLSHEKINQKNTYLPYVQVFILGLLSIMNLRKGIFLAIDGSQAGKHNAVLMLSLIWRKRSIPICWLTKSGGKGHFKTAHHIAVLQNAIDILLPLLPINTPVTVLGDGEFDAIELQELCLKYHWNYVLRTACNTVLYEDKEQFQAKDVTPAPEHDIFSLPMVEFTKKRFKYVHFVCWHDQQKHEEPIYLVSNLLNVEDIIRAYDQRYAIECLFKDLKSTSFNIHKTRIQDTKQVDNLLIIAALAFIILTSIMYKYDKLKWRKKVQRCRKDRKTISFFTFALRLIDYFIDYDFEFCIDLRIKNNDNITVQNLV